jgi:hypothetical protein
LLSTYVYKYGLAIPEFDEPREFSGGLVAMLSCGFHGKSFKADFSSLYPAEFYVHVISVPVHTVIFYYFSKPQVFIYLAIGHLFLILGLATILTQYFGIIGLTIAVVVGMVFNLLVPLFYVLMRLKQK